MAKQKNASDSITDRLDTLIRITQDLFILQALVAGAKVDDVRKALKINKWRVVNISKSLNLREAK
ncbi:MAG: hypothetical protein EPO20_05340 [Betaproteobacteria bacterium]|nr:MAG: hypothetical protein EPO20_05340 [Betaproteobacteria bacterium]